MTFNDIIRSEKPVLIDFFATWCGPCKTMSPILNDLKKQVGDSVSIIKIDIDKNPEVAASCHVQGVPTLILYKRSQVLWRQSGVVPADQLKKVIEANS